MIVVDSSIWIANLRNSDSDAVRRLASIDEEDRIVVGDLILLEVLQGARNEAHADRIERDLRKFPVLPMLDDGLAVRAARNYRRLRQLGHTPRRTIDVIIGTFCIERGFELLHADRDFLPMVKHLGLRIAR